MDARSLAALLLASAALAALPAAADGLFAVEASSLHAEADVAAAARLVALVQQDEVDAAPTDAFFRLQAETLRVESDTSRATVKAPGAVVPVEPTTESQTYADARLTGGQRRAQFRWVLSPLEGEAPPLVEVSTSCVDLARADGAAQRYVPYVDNIGRATTVVARDSAFDLDACTIATVHVSGAFRLSLWQWDATLEAPGSRQELWSGSRPLVTDAAGADGTLRQDRELFLFARGASLDARWPLGSPALLLVMDPDLVANGKVAMAEATGSVLAGDVEHDITGARLSLEGTSQLQIRPVGAHRFSASGQGEVTSLRSDGADILAVTARPEPSGGAAWWFIGAAVLVALAVLLLAVRRRDVRQAADAWQARATALERQGRHLLAAWAATRALSLDAKSGEMLVVRAFSRARRGRLGPALRDHERAHELLRDPRLSALNAFEASRCSAALGDAASAGHWLRLAVFHDPSYMQEADLDPAFAKVAAAPAFQAVVRAFLPGVDAAAQA